MIGGNKKGFTLMELMVYMAILGVIVLIAGEAFSNSTKFRVRTGNMIKATQEAENVAMLFKEDASQMGAKSSMESGTATSGAEFGDKYGSVNNNVYMSPTNADETKIDSSSFIINTAGAFSDVTFRRIRYDDNGYYEAVESIRWYVENSVLKRSCTLVSKKVGLVIDDNDPCAEDDSDLTPVEMATGVDSFLVVPATPSVASESDAQIFPPGGASSFRLIPRTGDVRYVTFSSQVKTNGVTLSQFFSNYNTSTEAVYDSPNQKMNQAFAVKNETTTGDPEWSSLCTSYGKIELEPNQEYEISFNIPFPESDDDKSLVFVPGEDHMSVGFRTIGTGDFPRKNGVKIIDDFLFFPPLDSKGKKGAGLRSMRFTVPEKIQNVCLAFTFACYSPLVSQGKITINSLKVKKIASSNYTFDTPPFDSESNITEKKNVKALQLHLQISRGKKNGGSGETGRTILTVPIPSNGPRD